MLLSIFRLLWLSFNVDQDQFHGEWRQNFSMIPTGRFYHDDHDDHTFFSIRSRATAIGCLFNWGANTAVAFGFPLLEVKKTHHPFFHSKSRHRWVVMFSGSSAALTSFSSSCSCFSSLRLKEKPFEKFKLSSSLRFLMSQIISLKLFLNTTTLSKMKRTSTQATWRVRNVTFEHDFYEL